LRAIEQQSCPIVLGRPLCVRSARTHPRGASADPPAQPGPAFPSASVVPASEFPSPRPRLIVAGGARRQGPQIPRWLSSPRRRACPLDRVPAARSPLGARGDGRERSTLAAVIINLMPSCLSCRHRGADHNWSVPDCSVCGRRDPNCRQCRRNHELRRLRGACVVSNGKYPCICTRYLPSSKSVHPLNPFIGRALHRRRR